MADTWRLRLVVVRRSPTSVGVIYRGGMLCVRLFLWDWCKVMIVDYGLVPQSQLVARAFRSSMSVSLSPSMSPVQLLVQPKFAAGEAH